MSSLLGFGYTQLSGLQYAAAFILLGLPACSAVVTARFRGASHLGVLNSTEAAKPYHHLVVAQYDEDVTWLQHLPRDFDAIVYQSQDSTKPHFVPNLGNEAAKYLSYIVEHYDTLPESVAFVQAGRQDWHDPLPKDESLPKWSWGAAESHGGIAYLPTSAPCLIEDSVQLPAAAIASPQYGEVLDEGECIMLHEHMPKQMQTVKEVWDEVFSSELGPLPQRWLAHCCAQFEVTRAAIQKHRREFYVNLLDWIERHDQELLASDYSNSMKRNHDPERRDAGHVMEVLWVLLFTSPESRVVLPDKPLSVIP